MHRLLEKFSAFASTAVIFTYLIGLFASTASFFAAKVFGVDPAFAAFTAVALAAAFEVQSFLEQRLTRANWQARNKLDSATPAWEAADLQFRVHLWLMIGLVAFTAYNSINFWALILNPQGAGDWVQVVIRGAAVPAAFLAAGFLTPLNYDASAMLASAAAVMLRKTMRTTLKQWERRLDTARNQRIDLAPVAIALMEDAGDLDAARRLRIISSALNEAEGLDIAPQQLHNSGQPLDAPYTPGYDSYGSYGAWSHPSGPFEFDGYEAQGEETREQAEAIAPARIAVNRAKPSKPRRSGNTPRRDDKHAVEDRVRRYVAEIGRVPSITELERGAGISASTASWWKRQLKAEAEAEQLQEA